MGRLLVVDFDYFFPEPMGSGNDDPLTLSLHDWGHSEGGVIAFLATFLWQDRASAFIRSGIPLPQPDIPSGWWNRFTFANDATGWATDSNCDSWSPDLGVDDIWLFDAHHDCGYHPDAIQTVLDDGFVTCENWMVPYHLTGAELHVRYPTWKTRAFELEPVPEIDVDRGYDSPNTDSMLPVFDAVHVCRSGAWVPTWCDPLFVEFLDSCPVAVSWTDTRSEPDRKFDRGAAEALAAQYDELMAMLPGKVTA